MTKRSLNFNVQGVFLGNCHHLTLIPRMGKLIFLISPLTLINYNSYLLTKVWTF